METVFDTSLIPREKRGAAWIDALCGNYVTVNAKLETPDNYFGTLKVANFGVVGVSETFGAPQVVTREAHHLRYVDKDCFYLQYLEQGRIGVNQRGTEFVTDGLTLGLYSASEAYRLDCLGVTRGRFLEIPYASLAAEMDGRSVPLTTAISGARGMGRVLLQFMRSLYEEGGGLAEDTKNKLGSELVSLTALALSDHAAPDEKPTLQAARLGAIKRFINTHATDPMLDPKRIAQANGISLRHLHKLFSAQDTTVADWLWKCRLEHARDDLARAMPDVSITEIALSNGFNSSSHFSTAFKEQFGLTPTEFRRRA